MDNCRSWKTQDNFMRWYIVLGFMLLASIILWAHVKLYRYAFDDAYIHFRIAQNFVAHGEPYYNPGESVKASSSSGWTLFLTGIVWFGRLLSLDLNLPLWVAVFNAFFTLCGVVVYAILLRRLSWSSHSPVVYGLLGSGIYLSSLIVSSIGLMETALTLLIVGVGLNLLLDNHPFCLSLFGAAVFFRLELLALLVLVGIYVLVKRQFKMWSSVLFTLFGMIPFIVFDTFFFRTILPNTIGAKSLVYTLDYLQVIVIIIAMGFNIDNLLLAFIQSYDIYVLIIGLSIVSTIVLLCAVVGIYVSHTIKSLMGFGVKRACKDADDVVLGILFWGISIAAVYFITRVMVFQWYIPLYIVPLFLVSGKLLLDSSLFIEWKGKMLLLTPLFLGRFISVVQVMLAVFVIPVYYPEFHAGARVRHYVEVGRVLYDQFPHATLLTSEIGGLGYGFRGYILDGVGLVSPQALQYHPMEIPDERSSGNLGAIPIEFIAVTHPDYIVSYDAFAEAFLKSDLLALYDRYQCSVFLEEDMPSTGDFVFWGSRYLNIFVRKDSEVSTIDYSLLLPQCEISLVEEE